MFDIEKMFSEDIELTNDMLEESAELDSILDEIDTLLENTELLSEEAENEALVEELQECVDVLTEDLEGEYGDFESLEEAVHTKTIGLATGLVSALKRENPKEAVTRKVNAMVKRCKNEEDFARVKEFFREQLRMCNEYAQTGNKEKDKENLKAVRGAVTSALPKAIAARKKELESVKNEDADFDFEFEMELAEESEELLSSLEEAVSMEKRVAKHDKYRAKMEKRIEKCSKRAKLERIITQLNAGLNNFKEVLANFQKEDPEKYADDIEDLKLGIKDCKYLINKAKNKLASLQEDTYFDFEDEDVLEEAGTYNVKFTKQSQKKRLLTQCELLVCKEENPALFAKYKAAVKKKKEYRMQMKKYRPKAMAKMKAMINAKKQIPDR